MKGPRGLLGLSLALHGLAGGAWAARPTVPQGSLRLAARRGQAHAATAVTAKEDEKESCGPLAEYPHARPKNFKDARKTKYDEEAKKTVPVTFVAGDIVAFECVPGFSTDGSKDGSREFDVECNEKGYYKPGGVCLAASKCGPLPNISNAAPTGNEKAGSVEFACNYGYSLDGEKVVAGGMGKNSLFNLKCIEFSGEYEAFKGECKPYAFVASTETARIYNKVSEALFVVSCKGSLKKAFGKDGKPPAGLDGACGKIKDAAAKGSCDSLVTTIKSDFEAKLAERETFDKDANKEWYEEKGKDRPGINDEATTFCTELWKLLELPAASGDSGSSQ